MLSPLSMQWYGEARAAFLQPVSFLPEIPTSKRLKCFRHEAASFDTPSLGVDGCLVPIGLGMAFGFRLEAVGIWFGILAGITSVACVLVMRWLQKTKVTAPPVEIAAFHVPGRRACCAALIRLTQI